MVIPLVKTGQQIYINNTGNKSHSHLRAGLQPVSKASNPNVKPNKPQTPNPKQHAAELPSPIRYPRADTCRAPGHPASTEVHPHWRPGARSGKMREVAGSGSCMRTCRWGVLPAWLRFTVLGPLAWRSLSGGRTELRGQGLRSRPPECA